LTRILTL